MKSKLEQPKRVLTQYSWYNLNLNHIFQFIDENSVHTNTQGDSRSSSGLRCRCYGTISLISRVDLLWTFRSAIARDSWITRYVFIAPLVVIFTFFLFNVSRAPSSMPSLLHSVAPHIYLSRFISLSMRMHAHTKSKKTEAEYKTDGTYGIWCHCKSATPQQMKNRRCLRHERALSVHTKSHRRKRTTNSTVLCARRWRCQNRKIWKRAHEATAWVPTSPFSFGENSSLANNRYPQLLLNDLSASSAFIFSSHACRTFNAVPS